MKTFTTEIPDERIVGHISRCPRQFSASQMRDALYLAIGKAQALSTDAACEKLGRALNIIEQEWTTPEWKRITYGHLRAMEKRYFLVSAKVWNGRAYQRIWRRS